MTDMDEETMPVVGTPLQLESGKAAFTSSEMKPPAKVAVIATHGMGQQVPFETIDAIIKGITGVLPPGSPPNVRARTVRLGDQTLQRAEFDAITSDHREVEVHVYEGYWAPLTEGRTTLRDVLRFLLFGSLNGVVNSRGRFWRYLFGAYLDFGPEGIRNRGWLFATFAAVLSVLILTALAVVVTGQAGLNMAVAASKNGGWLSEHLVSLYTNFVAVFVGSSILLLAPLMLLNFYRKKLFTTTTKRPSTSRLWVWCCHVAYWLLWLWVVVAIVTAAMVVVFGVWGFWFPQTLPPPRFSLPSWAPVIVWGLLYGVAMLVRNFLIQYLGDVAAYVQPHVLDRFLSMRLEIKKWVMDVASAVYRATSDQKEFEYQGVLIVGHSLGSVVAYDILNALINEDLLAGGGGGVVQRTRGLITFGSPLDKTAFVFGHQKKDTSVTRESLAASVQPLIQDYLYRPFEWINVYSKRDIISSELKYYDLPEKDQPQWARPVQNVEDRDALVPLLAHNEYWYNPAVFELIYSRL
jgi:hypothetical protein